MGQYATATDSFYVDEGAEENTTYHYRVSAVDGGGDEGVIAFARHGRTGNDTTALVQGADDRWISVSQFAAPVISPEQDYTLEFYFHPLHPIQQLSWPKLKHPNLYLYGLHSQKRSTQKHHHPFV